MIYGITYGLISGFCYTLVLMVGGSTGGADIIGVYYAKKKTKPIGTLLLILNNICLFTSTIIGTLGSLLVINPELVSQSQVYFDRLEVDSGQSASNIIQAILSPN